MCSDIGRCSASRHAVCPRCSSADTGRAPDGGVRTSYGRTITLCSDIFSCSNIAFSTDNVACTREAGSEPCVDGPPPRGVVRRFDRIACVQMSGLWPRSHMNAGQDGSRDRGSRQHRGRNVGPLAQSECPAWGRRDVAEQPPHRGTRGTDLTHARRENGEQVSGST